MDLIQVSIYGIVGVLVIVYRKKLVNAQKEYFLKQKDALNKSIGERILNDQKWQEIVGIIVGLGLIVLSIIKLTEIL